MYIIWEMISKMHAEDLFDSIQASGSLTMLSFLFFYGLIGAQPGPEIHKKLFTAIQVVLIRIPWPPMPRRRKKAS